MGNFKSILTTGHYLLSWFQSKKLRLTKALPDTPNIVSLVKEGVETNLLCFAKIYMVDLLGT